MQSPVQVVSRARRLCRRVATKWRSARGVDQPRLRRFVRGHRPESVRFDEATAPRVSIVVPCFGHAEYLPDAFASIVSQTVPPLQVVFVDDCSPDSTSELLRCLIEGAGPDRGRFTLVRHPRNLGQCATINRAVHIARSDAVMVLNDDDYLMHDAVERMQSLFADNRSLQLIGTKSVYFYNDDYLRNHCKLVTDSLLSTTLRLRVSQPSDVFGFRTGREIDMCHSGCTFTKEAWRAVGGYRHSWRERVVVPADRDFQIRVNALFPIAIVENAAFAFWRVNSSVDQGLFS